MHETLKNISGPQDFEIIAVSDATIFLQIRYPNEAAMQQAEPHIREALMPLSEFYACAPEESLSIGGTVTLSGNRVWNLSSSTPGGVAAYAMMVLASAEEFVEQKVNELYDVTV